MEQTENKSRINVVLRWVLIIFGIFALFYLTLYLYEIRQDKKIDSATEILKKSTESMTKMSNELSKKLDNLKE